jgi:sugar phosphate permease
MSAAHTHALPYRWVILGVFALLNMVVQLHWLALAPVTSDAAAFYGVDEASIGFLSMLFMLVYVFVGMPASFAIERLGLRMGVGLGAALLGVFGLVKGIYGSDYTMVCVGQVGIAVAQPFVLNAYTRLGAKWFPIHERATATGIAALSQYLGIIIAMLATPYLVNQIGIPGMMMTYGVGAAVVAVLFLALFREEPPTHPSDADDEKRLPFMQGLRYIFTQRDMLLVLYVNFIGIGVFNSVNTWIEQILAPRGFSSEQAGWTGAAMMVGGIVGALILPPWSDRLRRRIPFLVLLTVLSLPGLGLLAFAPQLPLILLGSFVLGFGALGAGPIGFQYAAEVSYPAPESIALGMVLTLGQISGAVAIWAMITFTLENGSMAPMLLVCLVAVLGNALVCSQMRESRLIRAED